MNKNYISIIALTSIAFNCEAWNIDNQKDYVGLIEKTSYQKFKVDGLTVKLDSDTGIIDLKKLKESNEVALKSGNFIFDSVELIAPENPSLKTISLKKSTDVLLRLKAERLYYKVDKSTEQEAEKSKLSEPDYVELTAKQDLNGKSGYVELTTKPDLNDKMTNLRASLYNCEKIIKKAWDCRDKNSFEKIVGVEEFNTSLKDKNEQEQNALKNGLVLLYCAYKYFTDDKTDLIDSETQKKLIGECAEKFKFSATNELIQDINWYLTDEKWNAAFWLENVKEDGHVDSVKGKICRSYIRYLKLKKYCPLYLDKLKTLVTLKEWEEFSKDSNKEKKNIQKLMKNGKLEIVLSKNDLPPNIETRKEYRIHTYIAKIEDDCWKYLKKVDRIILPSCVTRDVLSKFTEDPFDGKEIIVEIGKGQDYFESDLECYKALKSEYGIKVKALIEGEEEVVDIQVWNDKNGEPHLFCTDNEYSKIKYTGNPILEELTVVFESCKMLREAVAKDNGINEEQLKEKDITKYLDELRKKCKIVGAALTENDLPPNIEEEYRIPAYIAKIEDDCWKYLKSVNHVILPSSITRNVWSKFIGNPFFFDKEIIIEIDKDPNNFEVSLKQYEELKSNDYYNRVKVRIEGRDVDIQVSGDGTEDLYLCCNEEEYSEIKDTRHPILKKLIVIASESCKELNNKFRNNEKAIIEYMQDRRDELGCRMIGAALTENDLPPNTEKEYRIPAYIANIEDNCWERLENVDRVILPSGTTSDVWLKFIVNSFNDKNIRVEIGKDPNNFEVSLKQYEELKSHDYYNRVKVRIEGRDVDIQVSGDGTEDLYLWCNEEEYSNIKDTGHPILKKLIVVFESCKMLREAVAKDNGINEEQLKEKDITKYLDELRKKCKTVDVILAENDLPTDIETMKEYRIPAYITEIADECCEYLKRIYCRIILSAGITYDVSPMFGDNLLYYDDIIVEISPNQNDFESGLKQYKELKSHDYSNRVKVRIEGKDVDIQVCRDELGNPTGFWCTNKEYLKIKNTGHPILEELQVVFTRDALKRDALKNSVENVDSEEEIIDYMNKFKKKCACKDVVVVLTKNDLPAGIEGNKEYSIPKYITGIENECCKYLRSVGCRIILPADITYDAFPTFGVFEAVFGELFPNLLYYEGIRVEISNDKNNLESSLKQYENLKSHGYYNRVKALINGKDVDIKIWHNGKGESYFVCTNEEHLKIKDTGHPILERLMVVSTSNYLKTV